MSLQASVRSGIVSDTCIVSVSAFRKCSLTQTERERGSTLMPFQIVSDHSLMCGSFFF